MKYLKYRNQFLNEGFSAKSLSKTLGWLTKSGLKSSSTKFLEDLKKFCEKTDIPLSEISDQWFKPNVLKRNAVEMRAPEEVGNPSGLWCVKFWFSAQDGYMGYTITPERSKEMKKRKSSTRNIGESFDDDEVKYLLNNGNIDDIKTGELHPVTDYKSLKTGDIVCGYNNSIDYIGSLRWFKVFLSHNRNGNFSGGFLINPDIDGSDPSSSYNYDENGREIDKEDYFGEYYKPSRRSSCWQFMYSDGDPQDDHCKLHLYKPSDEPLHVFTNDKKEKEKEELDIYDFNLSFDINDGDYVRVDQLNREYDNWSIDNNKFKNSDFSIIFFADEFLPHQEIGLRDIRTDRTKSKEGALALMSDDDVKKINVEKRINYLIDKFHLDPSVEMDNMTNLNSILMKIFLDDFILFKVFYGYNTDIIEYLYRFFDHCQNLEGASPEDFKKAVQPHIDDIKRCYRRLLERYNGQINLFKENYDLVLKSDNKYAVDFFKEFMIISKKLKDKIRSKNIVNLYDASIIIDRLRNMRNSETNNSRLSYYMEACIDNFMSKDNVSSLINRINENEFNVSKKALKFIERQVDMI
jgi:hypothetical protein